jgi:anti-anti-sigma factor
MEAIAGFVRAGLRARHRVVYTGDDPDRVVAGLERHGIGTRAALSAGQLSATTAETSYLVDGVFDPVATIERWRGAVDAALAEGYLGIRAVGDMTWASRAVPGATHLPWYEEQVNTVFIDGYVAGVCAYDRRVFDPVRLGRLARAHPGSAGPNAGFDPAASLRMIRTRTPWGLRLSGEVDLSNRISLRATIDHLIAEGRPDVTVDLSDLAFADTAAVRILVHAAARRGSRLHLVGCSPSLLRLLDFHRAGEVPGLTVEAS